MQSKVLSVMRSWKRVIGNWVGSLQLLITNYCLGKLRQVRLVDPQHFIQQPFGIAYVVYYRV